MKINKKFITRRLGYHILRKAKIPIAIDAIRHCGISVVLDVGANTGQFAQELRSEKYRGEIHSFEPVPAAFAVLQKQCHKDAHWFAHPFALGATPGEKQINIMQSSDLSSFHNPSAYGAEVIRKNVVAATETVRVDTVDNFLTNLNFFEGGGKKIMLKMDTQGYDLEVFRGAQNALPHIVAIQSELAFRKIYADMPDYHTALKTYEDHGYRVAGLYPITNKNLTVIEMDCLLIREDSPAVAKTKGI